MGVSLAWVCRSLVEYVISHGILVKVSGVLAYLGLKLRAGPFATELGILLEYAVQYSAMRADRN